MKKVLLITIMALLITGCLGQFFVTVNIQDKVTIACEGGHKNAIGELSCEFETEFLGQIFSCDVALKDLKKDWKPLVDGNVAYGCKLIATIPKDVGDEGEVSE